MLLKQIKRDFNDVPISKEKDFNITYNNLVRWDGGREYMVGFNYARADLYDKNLLKTKYKYYDYKKLSNNTITGQQPYYLQKIQMASIKCL